MQFLGYLREGEICLRWPGLTFDNLLFDAPSLIPLHMKRLVANSKGVSVLDLMAGREPAVGTPGAILTNI
jgi:hypothetical protein